MDTDYEKRISTASSVYNDAEDVEHHQQYYYDQFNQQYQQQFGSPVDPNFYHQFQQQQYYNYYQHEQQRRIQQAKKPLPALQNYLTQLISENLLYKLIPISNQI